MVFFWFFELIFVLSAPIYIGYDIKIVIFRKLFFRPLLKNNKKMKNFINSVHGHFWDHRLIKIIYQKNLVKVIYWEVFALNYTRFRFLRIFWKTVRFWSFFVENGILRGYSEFSFSRFYDDRVSNLASLDNIGHFLTPIILSSGSHPPSTFSQF